MASREVDLARGEIWKQSLERSRTRRAAAAIARRRQLRKRGSSGSLLVVAALTGVLGAGAAMGHEVAQRPAAQTAGGALLKAGSRGPAVVALQRKLGGIAADGVYGPRTRAAVRRFQRAKGLAVDGIAGPQTLGALGLAGSRAPAATQEPTQERQTRERAPARQRGGSGASGALRRIAACESGGNPRAVSPDGRYRGKYQFSRETWRSLGGSGDPARASEAEQDRRAQQLYAQRGSSPWPSCG